MKPGTRCECRDAMCDCAHEYRGTPDEARSDCYRDAVRLVAVRVYENIGGPRTYGACTYENDQPVPMCESCAKHAEGGSK